MKSKKIFKIDNCYVNLPDDFEGGLIDVLKLIIKYREESKSLEQKQDNPNDKDLFENLWDRDDWKCSIVYGFAEIDDKTNQWNNDVDWVKK